VVNGGAVVRRDEKGGGRGRWFTENNVYRIDADITKCSVSSAVFVGVMQKQNKKS